ncbi:hypothetical protein [Paracoccus mutanolyticus]|uniref:hypothetical protein n=1 Tax=Paracoccus mutanolyticus TaxID=1499308 RepID=UPI0016770EB6|nr:hypothetical protein [Paracoccus mutanolyticus]
MFETMLAFEPPSVRLVEKNVSPSNVEDPRFLSRLRSIMERRRVPKAIIKPKMVNKYVIRIVKGLD